MSGRCFIYLGSRNFVVGKPKVLFLPIAIGIVIGTTLLESSSTLVADLRDEIALAKPFALATIVALAMKSASQRLLLWPDEFESLRCQFGTSNNSRGGRRYLPFVFTEQGVSMLSAVLNTDIAIKISIQIIRAFVELRKSNADINLINSRIDRIEAKQVISESKLNKVLNALEGNNSPSSGIFFDGQIFDAYVFSSELISKSKKSILLIDNYIDETTLLQLSKRSQKVNCIIYTERISEQLKLDLEKHNSQ